MTNMEKFFGFKIDVTDELDPINMTAFQNKAEKILAMMNYNSDEYIAYYHRFNIYSQDTHFGVPDGLAKRLDSIRLSFDVNQKQKKKKTIRFYNYLLDDEASSSTITFYNMYSIKYFIQGDFLANSHGFSNEIMTFINKNVFERHRKIKISIEAFPTDTFLYQLKRQPSFKLTQIDFKFKKPIHLKKPTNNSYTHLSNENDFQKENEQIHIPQNSLKKLHEELSKLHKQLEEEVKTNDDRIELSYIEDALKAIEEKDTNRMLFILKNVGEWTLNVSEKVSTNILTTIFKQQLGL